MLVTPPVLALLLAAAVAAPPQQHLHQTPIHTGLLDRSVRRHTERIRDCYERGLRRDASMEGPLRVRFEIHPGGWVGLATVEDSRLDDPQVEACVVAIFATMTFPVRDPEVLVVVRYPILFQRKPGFRVDPPLRPEEAP